MAENVYERALRRERRRWAERLRAALRDRGLYSSGYPLECSTAILAIDAVRKRVRDERRRHHETAKRCR